MKKKIRNESIFLKPDSMKIKKLKNFAKKNKSFLKNDYKSLFKFSLASTIVILIFFGLPIITNFLDNNFKKNSEVSNISKKNFEITFNNKKNKLKNIDDGTVSENVFEDIDVFNSDENNGVYTLNIQNKKFINITFTNVLILFIS